MRFARNSRRYKYPVVSRFTGRRHTDSAVDRASAAPCTGNNRSSRDRIRATFVDGGPGTRHPYVARNIRFRLSVCRILHHLRLAESGRNMRARRYIFGKIRNDEKERERESDATSPRLASQESHGYVVDSHEPRVLSGLIIRAAFSRSRRGRSPQLHSLRREF